VVKKLHWWIEEGQYEEKKKQGRGGLCDSEDNLKGICRSLFENGRDRDWKMSIQKKAQASVQQKKLDRVVVGCEFLLNHGQSRMPLTG